jgi:hypothetical protein
MLFIGNLVKYAKQIGKNGVSVLGDLGPYTHKSQDNDLVDYELSLPIKFDIDLRDFCLYHQKDFHCIDRVCWTKAVQVHEKSMLKMYSSIDLICMMAGPSLNNANLDSLQPIMSFRAKSLSLVERSFDSLLNISLALLFTSSMPTRHCL